MAFGFPSAPSLGLGSQLQNRASVPLRQFTQQVPMQRRLQTTNALSGISKFFLQRMLEKRDRKREESKARKARNAKIIGAVIGGATGLPGGAAIGGNIGSSFGPGGTGGTGSGIGASVEALFGGIKGFQQGGFGGIGQGIGDALSDPEFLAAMQGNPVMGGLPNSWMIEKFKTAMGTANKKAPSNPFTALGSGPPSTGLSSLQGGAIDPETMLAILERYMQN